MEAVLLVCGSPSCRASVEVGPVLARDMDRALRLMRWALEQQAGDTQPRYYCPRCKDGDHG